VPRVDRLEQPGAEGGELTARHHALAQARCGPVAVHERARGPRRQPEAHGEGALGHAGGTRLVEGEREPRRRIGGHARPGTHARPRRRRIGDDAAADGRERRQRAQHEPVAGARDDGRLGDDAHGRGRAGDQRPLLGDEPRRHLLRAEVEETRVRGPSGRRRVGEQSHVGAEHHAGQPALVGDEDRAARNVRHLDPSQRHGGARPRTDRGHRRPRATAARGRAPRAPGAAARRARRASACRSTPCR
jgi:hypothetical protein